MRVAFVSLGCVKNVVDSEKMLGQLAEAGCVIAGDEGDADVIVINTCGFLEAARAEADEVIREVVARKASGRLKRVVVAGCLAQRDGEAMLRRLDGIDALVGVNNRDDIVRAVLNSRPGRDASGPDLYLSDYHRYVQLDTARLRITPRHYAYLRISEGCDRKCTFCTIPAIRGPMHCKPPDLVMAEARELVSDGAVEIILVGQDTTAYGRGDDEFEGGLAALLRRLDTIDGLRRIRLMYAHPSLLTEGIMDAIADGERVCKYIDVPLQHVNGRILRAMGRHMGRGATETLLDRIRERICGVTIRTTLMTGFPGETEDEFEELRKFIEDFRFDALGVFPYSAEPETLAGGMMGQLPAAVKKKRTDALMRTQQEVAFALADERRGSCFDVLVDDAAGPGVVVGRHEGQAPIVDSVTYVRGCDAPPGEMVTVRCTGRDTYDLVATLPGAARSVLSA